MAWGRLDDKLHENAKAWKAGTASMGLWVLANSWCCDNLRTNGFIPVRVLLRWRDGTIDDDVEGIADELVRAGLWHRSEQAGEDGFLFHDWDRYRPESGRSSYDARRGNHVRWHANVGITKPDCEFCGENGVSPSESPIDRGDIGATSGRVGGESLPETRNPKPDSATRGDLAVATPGAELEARTSQTLVAEWIDNCGSRPPGQVVGQVAKHIGQMLDEDIPYDDVRRGLQLWQDRGQHPSTLPSFVHEARTPRKPRRQSENDDFFERALQRAEEADRKAG